MSIVISVPRFGLKGSEAAGRGGLSRRAVPDRLVDRVVPLQSRCYLWAVITTVLTVALGM